MTTDGRLDIDAVHLHGWRSKETSPLSVICIEDLHEINLDVEPKLRCHSSHQVMRFLQMRTPFEIENLNLDDVPSQACGLSASTQHR